MHARRAQVYPRKLCRAILKGITKQMRIDGHLKRGCFGMQVKEDEDTLPERLYGPKQGYSGKYKDDLTSQILKDDLVR